MAARREQGAPSALTVLEVAEGLRWSDPVLGASLAEHVRRLAGDDLTVRAAADRSVIRSLAESDRFDEVAERGVPLLTEARSRGDREDGATVLVELAAAATALGDPGLARRLLDRLGPAHDLPARIGATACAARAEACAADGDVAATDAAGDEATAMLLRVGQPESAVVRARIELARGVARRRAGDVGGALAVLTSAVSADPSGDVDGGRRSLAAAAELTELLVEAGRSEEARSRVRAVLPDGTPGPHVAAAVGRIRLALAAGSDDGLAAATTSAEELEAAGRTADAARAWELVATLAEAGGDLGRALASLRRGHALASAARGTGDRALRALSAVGEGADPLAAPSGPEGQDGADAPGTDGASGTPTRRRARRNGSPVDRTSQSPTTAPPPESGTSEPREAVLPGAGEPAHPAADDVPRAPWPDVDVVGSLAAEGVRGPGFAVEPSYGAAEVPLTAGPASSPSEEVSRSAEEFVAPGRAPRSTTRDELAELLASLTRSVDSSRAAASAMGLEPAPPAVTSEDAPGSAERNTERASASFAFGSDSFGSEPTTDTGASANARATGEATSEPSATRPTFDAFTTAPRRDDGKDTEDEAVTSVAPLPDDRFAPADDGRAAGRSSERAHGTTTASQPADSSDDLLAGFLARMPSDDRARDARGTADAPAKSFADEGEQVEPGLGSTRPAPSPRSSTGSSNGTTSSRGEDRRRELDDPGPTGRGTGAGPRRREDPTSGSAAMPVTDSGAGVPADARPRPRADVPSGVDANGSAADGVVRRAPADDRSRRGSGPDDADLRREARAEGERPRPDQRGRTPAPTSDQASARRVDEYDEELALTLATVLGEYHLPDVPMPPRRDDRRVTPPDPTGGGAVGDVSVPSARRHTSGSMPVPGEPHRVPRAEPRVDPASSAPGPVGRDGTTAGRGRPPESGARLADLLAEAMDAFRHVGPEAQDGARGPGVGSRRA